MTKSKTYAVVDLEMTTPALDGTGRIIQFSCTFIENGKISDTFSTLIDPQCLIPPEVQKLTGIKNSDVSKAPLFSDVADTIYALLQDTVFVAHNIMQDYRFLNAEFERAGYPELELKGIDTVQLAQILLPTLPSYRLVDLGNYLGIKHERPHQADSDTYVTAELFLLLQKRLELLPSSVLQTLCNLSGALLYDTAECFKEAYEEQRKKAQPLAKKWMQIEDLVILRPNFKTKDNIALTFPKTKEEQEQLFSGSIEWRDEQVKMMSTIADFFDDPNERRLLLEAPTGMGKTLGYLVPAAYASTQDKRIVISTATTALQAQLAEEIDLTLKNLFPFDLDIVVLKGNRHYIDLDKFWRSLKQPYNKNSRLLQMRLIVWLLQTRTGDLDELRLTTRQDPLFANIEHTGFDSLEPTSPFYRVDYLRLNEIAKENASFIITNHAYLLTHVADFKGNDLELIVDEAQNLPAAVAKSVQQVLDFDEIKILCDSMLVKMESQISFSFEQLIEQSLLTKKQYHALLKDLQVLDHDMWDLRADFVRRFLRFRQNGITEQPLSEKKFLGFLKEHYGVINKITRAYEGFLQQFAWLQKVFFKASRLAQIDQTATLYLLDFFRLASQLVTAFGPWQKLAFTDLEANQTKQLIWLSLAEQETAHLRLHFSYLDGADFLQSNVYPKFEHVLFLGAGLFTKQTHAYTLKQLNLPKDTRLLSYQGNFDYQKTLALIAKDAPNVGTTENEEYVKYLAKTLYDLTAKNHCQTMILFNSLDELERTYEYLAVLGLTKEREVLAQGVNGSPEKLKKRFILNQNQTAILLATGTFFEGIDLPEKLLELLVIVRLPFQAPNTLFNQVRYERARQTGDDPFTTLALPEAVLRLKQGFGRLIRTPNDRGAFVLLDSRILTKRYGQEFKQVFPDKLTLHPVLTAEIPKLVADFLHDKQR